jgi:hypothetical protein
MKPRSLPSRTPAKLSVSVHHQLNMYALAVGAAGVGLLASAQRAEARIVYTPANVRVPANGVIGLDLNHDRTTDFKIGLVSSFPVAVLIAEVLQTNEVWGVQSGTRWMAADLKAGNRIGKNSAFKNYSLGLYMAIVTQGNSAGPWIGQERAYLGLRFNIKGQIHYGWARFKVATQRGHVPFIKATLTGYAYETIPNKPITAGKTTGPDANAVQPTTLGKLALGRK